MDVKTQVGETAGKVWHLLNDNGPLTLTQLKKKLDGSGELLNFALGWLSREDKIEITPAKKSFRIQLR
ncbi:MAG TPA: winged helix-turn-helix domain-containing protein [Terriglobia bacterium]|jgi:hypothetical protein|nr:winged helix-turn-helix domain-containing protein [Terriglobia bacterium]